MRDEPTLVLVFEPESACHARLVAAGFAPGHATEIASYLAQSTDLAPEFDAIARECRNHGLGFVAVPLDDAPMFLSGRSPETTLVWTLTDGIAYFRGGTAPALARLKGLPTFGSDDSLFALCQDKFRSGAVMRALGLPAVESGLARNGEWLIEPPAAKNGWFVKPNRLGAKIGIWTDSHVRDPGCALELSRRVFDAYGDDVVVQPYVAGRNVRASFLSVQAGADARSLGVFFVNSGADFQTMEDSMALYGETGLAAKLAGRGDEPELMTVASLQPMADLRIRQIAADMMRLLGLRDVFSLDLRVEPDDTVHLIEFEVCPGLPCFDFRAYCERQWGMSLPGAMAQAAAGRMASGIHEADLGVAGADKAERACSSL